VGQVVHERRPPGRGRVVALVRQPVEGGVGL